MRIAILGAGLSGLVLAEQLQDCAELVLFDKSHGVGGRMATRRADDFAFDHGAQFFTARSKAFRRFLLPLVETGVIAQWEPRVLTLAAGEKPYKRDWFEPHYVAVPGMTALCKALAEPHVLQLECCVTGITPVEHAGIRKWQLMTSAGPAGEPFDWVLSTLPAPKMQMLFEDHLHTFPFDVQQSLAEVVLSPCFALMLGFAAPLSLSFDAARIKHPVLDWVSVNNSKPGRSASTALVLHSSASWARENTHNEKDWVAEQMLAAFQSVLPATLPAPQLQVLHRWMYASVEQPLEHSSVLQTGVRLGFCGDWCTGSSVEAAFTSAMHLAAQLKTQL